MGLDMRLVKKTYIGNEYKKKDEQIKVVLGEKETYASKDWMKIKNERISQIVENVMYWRKANGIHNWFVQNVQSGSDDCGEYYVEIEQLQELLAICQAIMEDNSKADKLLPTLTGFFFGGVDYDKYYFEDIEETIKILKELIKEDGVYYYTSSW